MRLHIQTDRLRRYREKELKQHTANNDLMFPCGLRVQEEKEKGGWKWKWGWGGLPDVEKPPSDKEEEKEGVHAMRFVECLSVY